MTENYMDLSYERKKNRINYLIKHQVRQHFKLFKFVKFELKVENKNYFESTANASEHTEAHSTRRTLRCPVSAG